MRGAGFRTLMENFNGERLLMADEACSFAQVCFDEAVEWARQRQTFGEPLIRHQVIRHKLVDIRMRLTSTRTWVDQATARMDEGDRSDAFVAELCLLKNHAGQTMQYARTRRFRSSAEWVSCAAPSASASTAR